MARTLREKRINRIIYFSLGGTIAVVILFIILFNIFTNKKNNEIGMQIGENTDSSINSSEEASSSIGKKVDEITDYEEIGENEAVNVQVTNNNEPKSDENNSSTDNTASNVTSNITEENNTIDTSDASDTSDIDNMAELAEVNNKPEVIQEEVIEDPVFTMPVDGEIVKHYGKDKLIYSDTLKEWTTHFGIDIKADKTAVVKSSSDGIVKSIKNDPRYGLTIVVEHQNGFSSVYSNLLSSEFVIVGEEVKSGQTLGTVGNSATFEILDDSHLHFEILKDGNSIDPEMYIK